MWLGTQLSRENSSGEPRSTQDATSEGLVDDLLLWLQIVIAERASGTPSSLHPVRQALGRFGHEFNDSGETSPPPGVVHSTDGLPRK